jgi:hypothetical protein
MIAQRTYWKSFPALLRRPGSRRDRFLPSRSENRSSILFKNCRPSGPRQIRPTNRQAHNLKVIGSNLIPDLHLPFDQFLSLGGRSEEISQICVVWGKTVAVSRYQVASKALNSIELDPFATDRGYGMTACGAQSGHSLEHPVQTKQNYILVSASAAGQQFLWHHKLAVNATDSQNHRHRMSAMYPIGHCSARS